MSLPERRDRWRVPSSVTLLLCLLLLGTTARASVPVMQEARAVAASAMASMADARSMPSALDGMPCATCCIAPAPVTQGFSGECKELAEAMWPAPAAPVPEPAWVFDTGGWRVRWPVRIAFCRWLD